MVEQVAYVATGLRVRLPPKDLFIQQRITLCILIYTADLERFL